MMVECISFYSELHLQPTVVLLHLSIQTGINVIIFQGIL